MFIQHSTANATYLRNATDPHTAEIKPLSLHQKGVYPEVFPAAYEVCWGVAGPT